MYKPYQANSKDLNDPSRVPSNMTNNIHNRATSPPRGAMTRQNSQGGRGVPATSQGAQPMILPIAMSAPISREIRTTERGERGERGPPGIVPIKGEPKFGDILKYDGGGLWIPIGSNNIYVGHATLENLSNPSANYNIGLGYKAGIGQDHPSVPTDGAIAIGYLSGSKTTDGDYQESGCISIGSLSSNRGQGEDSISIGTKSASSSKQGLKSIAVGYESGCDGQGDKSIAIGSRSGYIKQQIEAIAIGPYCGYYHQGVGSVALGAYAGMGEDDDCKQGDFSIAIGYKSAKNGQSGKSIVIDATGEGEMFANNSGLFVKPIRKSADKPSLCSLKYDESSGEIVYVKE